MGKLLKAYCDLVIDPTMLILIVCKCLVSLYLDSMVCVKMENNLLLMDKLILFPSEGVQDNFLLTSETGQFSMSVFSSVCVHLIQYQGGDRHLDKHEIYFLVSRPAAFLQSISNEDNYFTINFNLFCIFNQKFCIILKYMGKYDMLGVSVLHWSTLFIVSY